MGVTLRPAAAEDVDDLLRVVDMASQGLGPYLWARAAAPGEDAWTVGRRRLAGGEGSVTWRDGVIAEAEGRFAGGLLTFVVADAPEPVDPEPPSVRPAVALRNHFALGTLHVLAIAVLPEFRRRGIARALVAEAARRAGPRRLSLTVFDRNLRARRLYAALGFVEAGAAPLVKEGWSNDSDSLILMLREPGRLPA